jgi:hypothetical protein
MYVDKYQNYEFCQFFGQIYGFPELESRYFCGIVVSLANTLRSKMMFEGQTSERFLQYLYGHALRILRYIFDKNLLRPVLSDILQRRVNVLQGEFRV